MPVRTIAIGDLHGCSLALAALVEAIDPQPDDTIITVGDYVDRGIDSKGVLDQLIALSNRCRLLPLLGNHDQMMLHARDGKDDFRFWMNCGGITTLDSYGSTGRLDLIPAAHFHFLDGASHFTLQTPTSSSTLTTSRTCHSTGKTTTHSAGSPCGTSCRGRIVQERSLSSATRHSQMFSTRDT
jgi:hypothetical protein